MSAAGLPEVADPGLLVATRRALHRLAEDVVAPARVAATGHEIALEPRPGGFGTPPFPDGGEVRVEGVELVGAGGVESRAPVEGADPSSAGVLAAFWAFTAELLETMRAEAAAGEDPSGVVLWPEHFDVAMDLGAEGRRATYGGSPGDDGHDLPYLYVAPWQDPPPGSDGWDAAGFHGAELGYEQLAAAADAEGDALRWLRERRDALRAG